jgi:hypothetical protein
MRCVPRGSVDVRSVGTLLRPEGLSATTVADTPSISSRMLPVGVLCATVTVNVDSLPYVPIDGGRYHASS